MFMFVLSPRFVRSGVAIKLQPSSRILRVVCCVLEVESWKFLANMVSCFTSEFRVLLTTYTLPESALQASCEESVNLALYDIRRRVESYRSAPNGPSSAEEALAVRGSDM